MTNNDRLTITVALLEEFLKEARAWTEEQNTRVARNGGNERWLDNRKDARDSLIAHLERTFGGIK